MKKRNTRFRVTDLLIVLFCLAGTAASAFAFWQEYNRTLVKLNADPVGTISFKNRTAHRKFEDRVAWDRLKQESPVYNGDTIRTSEMSEAIITFRDTVAYVTLSENTLIRIFYDAQGAHIDFSGGTMEVNSGDNSVFVSNGASVIEVSGNTQASLNSNEDGLDLSVTSGNIRIGDVEIESGQMLMLQNDGIPSSFPVIAMTSMGSFAKVFGLVDGLAAVNFSWNSANFTPNTQVMVEIAADRDFTRIVETRTVQGTSSLSVPLPEGVYYWRAYPSSGDSSGTVARGPSGRIDVLPSAAIEALAPRGQEFTFSGESRIPFSWTPVEGAVGYQLEISSNAAMGSSRVSRQIGGTSVVQTSLEDGLWYWQVTPVFPPQSRSSAAPSGIETFSIVRGSSVPAAPQLTAPLQNGTLSLENPRLLWKYDATVSSWTVEVADNPQLSNPVVQQTINSNYYTVPAAALQEGKSYYWRVSAANGSERSVSVVRAFSAVPERVTPAVVPASVPAAPAPEIAVAPVPAPAPAPRPAAAQPTPAPQPAPPAPRPAAAQPAAPAPQPTPQPTPQPVAAAPPTPAPQPTPPAPAAAPAAPPAPAPQPTPQPVAAAPTEPPPVVEPQARTARVVYKPVSGNYPRNGYSVSTNQLRTTPSVNFVWEGSATEFRFALYRGSGETIISPVSVNSPAYTLTNPSRLNAGEYVWQVLEKDSNGNWNPSTSTRFTVTETPPVIKTIPTSHPGALYGDR